MKYVFSVIGILFIVYVLWIQVEASDSISGYTPGPADYIPILCKIIEYKGDYKKAVRENLANQKFYKDLGNYDPRSPYMLDYNSADLLKNMLQQNHLEDKDNNKSLNINLHDDAIQNKP